MKILLLAAVALLAGCAGLQPSTGAPGTLPQSGKATGLTPLAVQRDAALTMPHYVPRAVHSDHGRSWVLPQAKESKVLLYVGDWSTNDEYIYDYPSGKAVGTITGLDEPYGGCVDAKGDVYIANFGNGDIDEYAHGSTKLLKTYSNGGEPMGCAVDSKGDLAATSFDPGEVTVYAKGNPSDGTTYSDSSCEYIWTMGYDNKDNLVGVGEENSIDVCALLNGSTSETTLTEQGITIDFPAGTTWDGKYIALGDQEAGGTYETGMWPSTISGTTISSSSEVKFSASCYSDYVDDVNPFVLGTKNTPVDKKQGKFMVGNNLWCVDAGSGGGVDVWNYPAGGGPIRNIPLTLKEPYGVVLSIKTGK